MTGRRGARGVGKSADAEPPDLGLFDSGSPPPAPRRAPRSAPPPPPPPLEDAYKAYDDMLDGAAYPGETASTAVTVSVLTQTARDVLEGAFIPLWVRGEVSDFKAHRNGHWYFSLRDRTAQIKCVIWNRDQRSIPAAPDDGMQVAAFGRLSVYAARGEMQYAVTKLEAEGDGLRRKALEVTRKRLEADGLLSLDRKRPLPRFPRVIAVITSPDGAALHDIVAVVRRRGCNVRLVVVPAAVQGETAPRELRIALDKIDRWGGADLVIIARGGGAREDLWAFNDERVARALAACAVPTISAIGHEVDISICDLVADHRAPTPSAAAEAATRTAGELRNELRKLSLRMGGAARALIRANDNRLRHLARDVADASAGQVTRRQTQLRAVAGRLHALSPLATLARGYAVARDAAGATLSTTAAFHDDMPFDLIVRDGIVPARVRPAGDSPGENA